MNITLSQVYRDRTPKSALQRNLFIEFLLPKAMGNRALRMKIRALDRAGKLATLLPDSFTDPNGRSFNGNAGLWREFS